jgi:hypothetical protein
MLEPLSEIVKEITLREALLAAFATRQLGGVTYLRLHGIGFSIVFGCERKTLDQWRGRLFGRKARTSTTKPVAELRPRLSSSWSA